MKDFSKQIFSTYKKKLIGLPSFCRLVMLDIFEYCDHTTGTISINSLDKLARESFYVDPSRGRQKEDINGDTIRNAFRTIKAAKSDHFKFTTVNQRIVIDMPFLRELYQSIHRENSDVAAVLSTDVAEAKTLAQSGETPDLEHILAGDVAEVLAAASLQDAINAPTHAHAKIKPNPTKPNNNTVLDEFSNLKQPIADDFYPSQFVIDKALSLGFSKVTDTTELNKFISFNKACGSQWKDYDYVYLRWLERDAEREQALKEAAQPLKPKQMHANSNTHLSNMNTSGRFNHEQHRYADKGRASQQVIDAWRDEFDYCEQTNRFNPRGTPTSAPVIYIDIDSLGPNV